MGGPGGRGTLSRRLRRPAGSKPAGARCPGPPTPSLPTHPPQGPACRAAAHLRVPLHGLPLHQRLEQHARQHRRREVAGGAQQQARGRNRQVAPVLQHETHKVLIVQRRSARGRAAGGEGRGRVRAVGPRGYAGAAVRPSSWPAARGCAAAVHLARRSGAGCRRGCAAHGARCGTRRAHPSSLSRRTRMCCSSASRTPECCPLPSAGAAAAAGAADAAARVAERGRCVAAAQLRGSGCCVGSAAHIRLYRASRRQYSPSSRWYRLPAGPTLIFPLSIAPAGPGPMTPRFPNLCTVNFNRRRR